MINWKVRFKNKWFWVSIIPATFLVVQSVLVIFGIEMDFSQLNAQLVALVEAVFAALVVLGVVVDTTTPGLGDSERALGYTEPGK